jgi:hypothetical protein
MCTVDAAAWRCARGVEVAAADLEAGAEDEGLVGQDGRHGTERGRADAVGLVPLAGRHQGLDLVGDERGLIEPVAVQRLAGGRREPRRLARPSQHRQRVGERAVHPFLWHGTQTFLREP